MRHGATQYVATDEVCCPLEAKLKGSRIDDVMGGNSGVEPRVSLMYTQTVRERGFSLEEFVALVASNAAKIVGLYPRKGTLAVGSDADIVLLDPGRAGPIRKENMHKTDYAPRGLGRRRLAERDRSARQGRGREPAAPGRARRRPIPAAQDRRRDPQPPGALAASPRPLNPLRHARRNALRFSAYSRSK